MIYTVTFNPALDYTMYASDIKIGELNRISHANTVAGGKGINVSLVLSNLGIPSTTLGFVGGFIGVEIERQLRAANCVTDFIYVKGGNSRINVKVNTDVKTELNADGPTILPEELDAFMDKIKELKDGDYLVLSGSLAKGLPSDIYGQILGAVHGKDIKTIVDTSGDALKEALEYAPFLVKPNRHELEELFETTIESEDDVIKYASFLQDVGAQNVLVSLDKDGAILLDENGVSHRMPAPQIEYVNSVGSGDSMVAGFISSYLTDGDYATALKYAVACGSATTASEGLATLDVIQVFL